MSYKIATISFLFFLFFSCSINSHISAQNISLLNDSSVSNAHVGICVYSQDDNKFLYNYNSEKYFTPASNTKLFSMYAGMKYLGDSLTAFKYLIKKDTIYIIPTGDPTLLHPDFSKSPGFEFLKSVGKPLVILESPQKIIPYGKGWSIDDFLENYIPIRSSFPVSGNAIAVMKDNNIVFNTNDSAAKILSGLLKRQIVFRASVIQNSAFIDFKSQATDSMLGLMMRRSDNFYAEQTLLMAAYKKNGDFSDSLFIDNLLRNELKDIPQKPNWIDGSGLSRYNLFTPNDFVFILDKMLKEFGTNRLKKIFPSGGEGTLTNYYLQDKGFLYAKTGTMGGVVGLSGFMFTSKNKLLLFSVMVNNFNGSATPVKKAVEKFLHEVRISN